MSSDERAAPFTGAITAGYPCEDNIHENLLTDYNYNKELEILLDSRYSSTNSIYVSASVFYDNFRRRRYDPCSRIQ
jgi:hypothetical protein